MGSTKRAKRYSRQRRLRWALKANPNMAVETADMIMDAPRSQSRSNTFGDTSIPSKIPVLRVPARKSPVPPNSPEIKEEPYSPKVKDEPSSPRARSSSFPAIPRMSGMPDHLVLEYIRRI